MARIEQIAMKPPGVEHTVAMSGQSILLNANAPDFGAMYVMLKDFHERAHHPELSADAIGHRLLEVCQGEISDATINVFGAPPVEGLGTAGGFKVVIEDRTSMGPDALQAVAEAVVQGEPVPELQGLFTSFRANTPWLLIDIDRTQAQVRGVSTGEIFNALQVFLGGYYVNDFNRFGRTWQVNVQAGPNFRKQIEDLRHYDLRNNRGEMVPFGSLATVKETQGPILVMRYNMYPATMINANAAPGYSSGQAIERLEGLVKQALPPTMRPEWTELALLQLQTGDTALWVFVLAVVLVFLVLAAQYRAGRCRW